MANRMRHGTANRTFRTALVVLSQVVGLSVSTAAAAEPLHRTQALMKAFQDVRTAPEKGELTAADRASNKEAFDRLDTFFYYDRIVNDPIVSIRRQFNAAQHKRYADAFRELIRLISYPRSGSYLREAALTYGAETITGNAATVKLHTELRREDFENDILFRWERLDGRWVVVDVSFDGASLVNDYRNQFARIIKQDGVDGLLKKLETRLAEERSKKSVN